jgi:hypothetical protein
MPSDYQLPPAHLIDWEVPLSALPPPTIAAAGLGTHLAGLGAPAQAQSYTESSRVLRLAGLLTAEERENGEELTDVLRDVNTECGKYGAVQRIVVPSSSGGQEEGYAIYVEFKEDGGALLGKAGLELRAFSGRRVVPEFYDQTRYANDDLMCC